jgi:hypothetical protein
MLAVCIPASASLLHLAHKDASIYQQDEKQQDKKQGNKKSEINATTQKVDPDKPDIREVPKARRQSRPTVVAKPNVRIKPIKIIRPRIKKP